MLIANGEQESNPLGMMKLSYLKMLSNAAVAPRFSYVLPFPYKNINLIMFNQENLILDYVQYC